MVWSVLGARPGFEVGQAEFLPASKLDLSLGWERYRDPGIYGASQHLYDVAPIGLRYALARNVQMGLFWPMVGVENLTSPTLSLAPAAGDITFELAFGHDELEYDYREAFVFSTRIIDESPAVPRSRAQTSVVDYNRDATSRDYYPFVFHNTDFSLGWDFTKRLEGRVRLHASVRYVYELSTNETLTNVFAFNGLIDQNPSNAQNTAGLSNFQDAKISFFSLEKIFQKLFWTTSLTDPWSDKANDHIEYGLALDTTWDLHYDFAGTPVEVSVSPFLEISGAQRFTQLSMMKSHLQSTLGAELAWGPRLRTKFGFTRILWAENNYDYSDGARLELSFLF